MKKISLLIHFFLFLTSGHLCSQQYIDSVYNEKEKIRVGRYIKNNKKENVVEYYENDSLKFKIAVTFKEVIKWTIETKLQEIFYNNGHLKSSGNFLVIKIGGYHWGTPINRHLNYRKNGRIKSISNFTKYGIPITDSIFNRNGSFKKNKISHTDN